MIPGHLWASRKGHTRVSVWLRRPHRRDVDHIPTGTPDNLSGVPRSPTATERRRNLRRALDEQRAQLDQSPYAGPDTEESLLAAGAHAVTAAVAQDQVPHRVLMRAVVRGSLADAAQRAPGHALEVRVAPFGAIQCLEGPRHTRGTPSSVVETTPEVWVRLCTGELGWQQALTEGVVAASGAHTDLDHLLPLYADQPT